MKYNFKYSRQTEHNLHITYEAEDNPTDTVTITVHKSSLLYKQCLMNPELIKAPIHGAHVTVPLPQIMVHRVTQKRTAHIVVFVLHVYDTELDAYVAAEPAEAIAARIIHANYIPLP